MTSDTTPTPRVLVEGEALETCIRHALMQEVRRLDIEHIVVGGHEHLESSELAEAMNTWAEHVCPGMRIQMNGVVEWAVDWDLVRTMPCATDAEDHQPYVTIEDDVWFVHHPISRGGRTYITGRPS